LATKKIIFQKNKTKQGQQATPQHGHEKKQKKKNSRKIKKMNENMYTRIK